MQIVLQLIINAIIAGSVYALVASGLTFIYATSRIFHLAHGVVILLGGYVFHYVWVVLGFSPALAAVCAIVVSVATGLIMNELVYETQRKRKAKRMAYLISTIALLMIGNALVLLLFGSSLKAFSVQTEVYRFFDLNITLMQIILIIVSTLLLLTLSFIVKKTKFGKAMRATADNEEVAEVMGIKTRDIRRLSFLVGSLLGAIAGILIGLEFNLDPNMGVYLAIKGFTAMVIGGVGSIGGAIFGAFIVGLFEQIAVWFFGAGWKNSMAFVLLFFFLLLRPQGLFGMRKFK
ncbi:branched-chain amino acid ABC transporter permease [Candidatus Uhrbacteria bacterium]|nr:branched-chain amino acid ABC transporter permease [Candidatus Uhrbacteria bacterium]